MRVIFATVAALLLLAPTSAWSFDASETANQGFDAVILRPLGFMTMIIGGVAMGPAVLFGAANGRTGVDEAYDIFLAGPIETTFERPLGEF